MTLFFCWRVTNFKVEAETLECRVEAIIPSQLVERHKYEVDVVSLGQRYVAALLLVTGVL